MASSPLPGRPASRTAVPAVVPAGTRIGATREDGLGAVIGSSPIQRRGVCELMLSVRTSHFPARWVPCALRPIARGMCSDMPGARPR
ncbi:Uncharacterised protein [Mycobacteroides abscessus subsp. abscessus]|nr:Uncharacterised protein [Mycobacteroides abscessus subsp. abscessus]